MEKKCSNYAAGTQNRATAIQQEKTTFEPLEMKVVDVKVEKGYATSGGSAPAPVDIDQWKNGNW